MQLPLCSPVHGPVQTLGQDGDPCLTTPEEMPELIFVGLKLSCAPW